MRHSRQSRFKSPQHRALHKAWHRSMARRLLFVLLIAGVLSFVLWGIGHHLLLDQQLVYAYSTSMSIWVLTDPLRQCFFPSNGGAWSRSWKVWTYIAFSIAAGFVIGMLIGDRYAGFSTLALIDFAPQKFVGLIVMCIAVSSAFTVFFYQQNRLQVMEQQATESKLQLLQSQLEPHMLFNTLANLRALIGLDTGRAEAMLDRVIDYLRATLGASRVISHALTLEFDRLDDYLALMQIRMGTRLHYTLDLPEALKASPCPALILQPIVENAVLHGIEPSAVGGEIFVTAKQVNKNLILTVKDTGLGFENTEDRTSNESNSGFGLAQLRERLETLYAGYASVEMTANTPTGTIVTITIPTTTPSHETNYCPYC